MGLGIGDIRRAHAALGTAEDVVGQRRVLYGAIADLASRGVRPGIDELDSPAVRGHLGAVAAGPPFGSGRWFSLSELVTPDFVTVVAGSEVRLASTPTAPVALDDALLRIGAELRRHDASASSPTLVIGTDPRATAAFDVLVDGARLITDMAPGLLPDLLPHIGLFAVLAADPDGRLGSASAREFPGLVVIPEPQDALEAAEAIVHEGAHQKFFDLAVTRSMIEDGSAPSFAPSWASAGAPLWPLEQTFAAWHAYCCLSAFAAVVDDDPDLRPHPASLLPHAQARASELSDWLVEQGGALGPDAHLFLSEMVGRSPTRSHRTGVDRSWASSLADSGQPTAHHRYGDRALVVVEAVVPVFYWVTTEELDRELAANGRFSAPSDPPSGAFAPR